MTGSIRLNFKLKYCWTILFIVVFGGCQSPGNGKVFVTDLQCNHMGSPMGIDTDKPHFSWILQSDERDVMQYSYQIIVALENPGLAMEEFVWNSGDVISSNSINVLYKGEKLLSQQTYYWKVRLTDQNGNVSPWSTIERFHTGYLDGDLFKSSWIKAIDPDIRSPLFRKQFSVSREVKEAFIYVSAIGMQEVYLNGNKVNEYLFEPATTQYSERILYSVYDVTDFLTKGENVIGVWMGEGQSAFTQPRDGRFANVNMKESGADPMLLLELKLRYDDGTEASILSDKSWKFNKSAITFNNYYGGEDYDARLEIPGWKTSDYNDEHWQNVVTDKYEGKLSAQIIPAVKEINTLEPIVMIQRDDTTFEYDFGTTIGGYWEIEVEGDPGVIVTIRGTEKCGGESYQKPLSAENQLYWGSEHSGRFYSKDCFSRYILAGNGIETYKPRFFYQGFRYLQVEISDPDVSIRNINIHSTRNAVVEYGDFSSSDPYLNKLYQVITQTFRNNLIQGIPLSNPNSEKFGWTGDVWLFADVADYIFDLSAFWVKWLQDFKDAQDFSGETGMIPETVPELRSRKVNTDMAWLTAYPVILNQLHARSRDTMLLAVHYLSVKRWFDFMIEKSDNLISGGRYGDHMIPNTLGGDAFATPEMMHLVNTAYLFKAAKLISSFAYTLKKSEERAHYQEIAAKIYQRFNEEFFNGEEGIYQERESPDGYFYEITENIIPLQVGLVPDSIKDSIVEFVEEKLRYVNYGTYTGILGTKALVDVFLDEDPEVLMQMVCNRAFPGWRYMVDSLGATTLNQKWNGLGDYNHCMFGSVAKFFFEGLAGIKTSPSSGPMDIFLIEPYHPDNLDNVTCSTMTSDGLIVSNWEKVENGYWYEIQIPPNSMGEFRFKTPTQSFQLFINKELILEDNKKMNSPSWIKKIDLSTNKSSIHLASGNYQINLIQKSNEPL